MISGETKYPGAKISGSTGIKLWETKLHSLFVTCLCLIFFSNARAQGTVENFTSLSLEQATALALNNNPALRVATSGYDINAAGVRISKSGYYPNLSFSATGFRNEGTNALSPLVPLREQKYYNYTAGFQVSQLLWDFGRTMNRVESSENLVQASNYDVLAAKENVIVNVQTAYYSLIEAQYVEQVNEETLRQTEEHLRIAKAFFTAGRRPQYDVTQAEVNVANARVNLLTSQNQIRIARLQLENAMGIQHQGDYVITDSMQVVPFKISMEEARSTAFQNRSELKALDFRVQSNEKLVSAAWDQNFPSISATGGYNWNGYDLPLLSRWNAGLTLSFPLFQGFNVNAQVEQARALVEQTKANLESTRQSVLLDVSQNYLATDVALQRMDASKVLIQSADENLRLAQGRYNSGVGSATEITDAQLALSNARIINIQALYDYNTSLIKLRKSMGTIYSPGGK